MADVGRRHRASGRARREALIDAAVEVAAERGMGAVTHRSVTERAGVPLATASYFFASIDELAAEAMHLFVTARTAELEALAAERAAQGDPPDEIAETLARASGAERTKTLAQFEAYLHAAREPSFRPAVADALAAFDQFVTGVLRAAGGADPEGHAASFVAVADGLALRRLALGRPPDPDELQRALRAMFIGYLVDAPPAAGRPNPEPADPRCRSGHKTCEHEQP